MSTQHILCVQHVLCMIVLVSQGFRLGSPACEFKNEENDEETNVCYHKKDVQTLICERDERIFITNIINRVKDECTEEDCCKTKSSDKLYDIKTCSKETHTFQPVIREVLAECSQKKHCVLVSGEDSPLQNLRNIKFDQNTKKSASMMTVHKCIKDYERTLIFCQNQSFNNKGTDKPIFISSQNIKPSLAEETICKCDIKGNYNATLLDVRLGPVNKLTVQGMGTEVKQVFQGGDESVYFSRTFTEEGGATLDLSINRSHPPESVWIRVEGNKGSVIEVSCNEPGELMIHTPHNVMSATDAPSIDSSQRYLPYMYFGAGFVMACCLLGVGILVYRMFIRKFHPSVARHNTHGQYPLYTSTEDDRDCVDPMYSLPDQLSSRGSVATRHGSFSTRQGSFSRRKPSTRVTSHYLDETDIHSGSGDPEVSRPLSKSRPKSKPDLSLDRMISGNSNQIKSGEFKLTEWDSTPIQ